MLKMQLREILSGKIISVAPDTPLIEAVDAMREHGISCIPVVGNGRLKGIFTERNIVEYAVQSDFDFRAHTIGQVMSPSVLTAGDEDYLYSAYNKLSRHHIRHLIVVDTKDHPVGVLTQSDIVSHIGSEHFTDVKKISQIMSKRLVTSAPEQTVQQALVEMANRSISCLVVAKEEKPVGIITERDVARLVCGHRDNRKRTLQDVMSAPVVSVPLETPVYEAALILRKRNIRRLVIVNENGCIEGLTTQSDIVRGLEGKYVEILNQVVQEKDSKLQITLKDLHEKTTLLNNILRSAVDLGIVATNINYRIAFHNPATEEILNISKTDLSGRDIRFQFPVKIDLIQFNRALESVKQHSRHTFSFDFEHKGEMRTVQVRISGIWDEDGQLEGFLMMLSDVTERKKAEETIQYMAFHDTLTGLLNRGLMKERLNHDIARCKRNGCELAVLVMDLDRFKAVNDTFGHHAGDLLLQTTALRLKSTLRKSDTVFRIGGDEFLIILPEIRDATVISKICDKITAALEEPVDMEEGAINTTVSIGAALFPHHARDGDALSRLADKAMYRAKEKSRANGSSNWAFGVGE